jgi:hypothetical protein
LERREGELAHRTLGYSVRAGSLDASELRKCYRQIERYVYYYLPRDTPGEEKLCRTAATAPRRLVYLPGDELQIAGQVCYRPTDSEGRPGSYFAHVLFRDAHYGGPAWSAVDCLRLWHAAGWVEEDTPRHAFRLPPLSTLDALLKGERPAIDDHVLWSFVATPANGTFDDPRGVIPTRWRGQDPAVRRALLADALDSLLEIGGAERLLLVVEPELAALVFYGMFRLLPRGSLCERASFSTFEPNPDRLCTTLAATTFHEPLSSELHPEAYRSGGVVINTFTQRRTERRRGPGLYASYVVARLAEHGWPAVDRMLAHMQACGAKDSTLLEPLAATDRLLPALLSSQAPADRSWRQRPKAVEYVRCQLVQDLSGMGGDDVGLRSLAGTPAQRLILELVAAEGGACRAAIEFLLQSLPPDWAGEVVAYPSLSLSDKAGLLASYVAHRGDLPAGSEWIWDQADKMLGGHGKPAETLLVHVLAGLEPPGLERFYLVTASSRADIFLPCVLEMCRLRGGQWEPLTRLLARADDTALLSLYHRRGAAFFSQYPDGEPAMAERLCHMSWTLTAHPMSFVPRLEMILAAQENLGDEGERQRALAWDRCRKSLFEIARLAREGSGRWRRQPTAELETACRAMADAAAEAMPPEAFPNDQTGAEREKFLHQLSAWVVRDEPLFPSFCREQAALWQKVRARMVQGTWPAVPLNEMVSGGNTERFGRWFWVAAGMAVGLMLAIVAILIQFWAERTRNSNDSHPPAIKTDASGKSTATPAVVVDLDFIQPAAKGSPPPANNSPNKVDVNQPSASSPTAKASADVASSPANKPSQTSRTEWTPDGIRVLRGECRVVARFVEGSDGKATRLSLRLLDGQGRPMTPTDASRRYVLQCTLGEKYRDGTEQERTVRGGESGFDPVFLSPEVQWVCVRFHFLRSPGPLAGPPGGKVAQSGLYTVEDVQGGMNYTISVSFSEAEMELLERLSRASGPRQF